jgi:hypothetical protein
VFDNQCADYVRAHRIVLRALIAGWAVDIRYVYRSMRRVVRGVIGRSERTGRWSRLDALAGAHAMVQASVLRLAVEFGGRSRFSLMAITNPDSTPELPPHSFLPLTWLLPGGTASYHNTSENKSIAQEELQLALQEGRVSAEVAALIGPAKGD